MLTVKSCATGAYESCQVRKEAALSMSFCVQQGSFSRAFDLGNAYNLLSISNARSFFVQIPAAIKKHPFSECFINNHGSYNVKNVYADYYPEGRREHSFFSGQNGAFGSGRIICLNISLNFLGIHGNHLPQKND